MTVIFYSSRTHKPKDIQLQKAKALLDEVKQRGFKIESKSGLISAVHPNRLFTQEGAKLDNLEQKAKLVNNCKL